MKGYRVNTQEQHGELTWSIEECDVYLRTADDQEAFKTKAEATKELKAIIRSRAEAAAQRAENYKREAQRLRDQAKGV